MLQLTTHEGRIIRPSPASQGSSEGVSTSSPRLALASSAALEVFLVAGGEGCLFPRPLPLPPRPRPPGGDRDLPRRAGGEGFLFRSVSTTLARPVPRFGVGERFRVTRLFGVGERFLAGERLITCLTGERERPLRSPLPLPRDLPPWWPRRGDLLLAIVLQSSTDQKQTANYISREALEPRDFARTYEL